MTGLREQLGRFLRSDGLGSMADAVENGKHSDSDIEMAAKLAETYRPRAWAYAGDGGDCLSCGWFMADRFNRCSHCGYNAGAAFDRASAVA